MKIVELMPSLQLIGEADLRQFLTESPEESVKKLREADNAGILWTNKVEGKNFYEFTVKLRYCGGVFRAYWERPLVDNSTFL